MSFPGALSVVQSALMCGMAYFGRRYDCRQQPDAVRRVSVKLSWLVRRRDFTSLTVRTAPVSARSPRAAFALALDNRAMYRVANSPVAWNSQKRSSNATSSSYRPADLYAAASRPQIHAGNSRPPSEACSNASSRSRTAATTSPVRWWCSASRTRSAAGPPRSGERVRYPGTMSLRVS